MGLCYFELRHLTNMPHTSLAADIARHMQTRQHLGKTIVICDKPIVLMSAARKQWFKRARALQKERASTINAEKILRLTNTITHMHRMSFVTKPPEQQPHAHVYFIAPQHAEPLPINTYSLYLTTDVSDQQLSTIANQLPHDAVLVDYTNRVPTSGLPFQSKKILQEHLVAEWQSVDNFLAKHGINLIQLTHYPQSADTIDDALDTLLGISRQFLQVASDFQHALELTQPIALTPAQQRQYDIVILLAHRVQALNPHSAFASRFTHNLTTDDTFFLHDIASEHANFADTLSNAISRHHQAGRSRLARALTFATH